ncbi:MAG: class I SAM-dependent DNA methyltransferase [Pseudomonadota bacterium]
MTPAEFIAKWTASPKRERVDSQPHFLDLCRLLEIEDPATADPAHDWFTFEKGASKTTGGNGWADVWRRGCFGWEYKGAGGDLDAAFRQLLNYSVALENPPLLIVSDMERFRIHTNWTNTVQETHEFRLEDLADAKWRDLLRACFLDPESLRPRKTRQTLTEEAASKFAALALRLRQRGHDPQTVAHFVNRLVFCMFAEDAGLLPNKMFQRMLEHCRTSPQDFQIHARTLFAAMKDGGMVGFERVEWFNGGLFDNDEALALEKGDVAELLSAARLDWSDIDPSILGTLFERGLDPDKRSQLGAHYTDRDKIMQIIKPVVIEPLTIEWADAKGRIEAALDKASKASAKGTRTRALKEADAAKLGFLDRLSRFRVLDPACGSGNFLYLALLALKDIEHRVNLDAEALGLQREFPRLGPECVRGIELNPYAAELARVSVWIGEIQWMRRNGFEATRNPILRPLETIECRDAVLTAEGARADWPDADAVVGNPPFLGNKKMIAELGEDYATALRRAWSGVPGGVDLVAYWFAKAWEMIAAGRVTRAGLVATNSLRGGANREVLKRIVGGGRIFEAWSDESWTVEGAAVRVSLVCFDGAKDGPARLDGRKVEEVFSDLSASATGLDLTKAQTLKENANLTFQGFKFGGPFEIDGGLARELLKAPVNPNGRGNCDVIRRWFNGMDITRRVSERWCIDFGLIASEADAALYERPFERLKSQWAAENARLESEEKRPLRYGEPKTRATWWIHQRPRPELRSGLAGLSRFIATPEVAKHRLFVWLKGGMLASGSVYSIARDDDTTFGILHSCIHGVWALRMGTSLEDRPRYTPSTTFETFPFPDGLAPTIPAADYAADPRAQAIAAAAARLNELREAWLNPSDLVERVSEVVSGYPDRILPKDEAAAKELKKRTLTNLYNARPAWLDHAHKALDEAVADAYGWGDDWRAGRLDDDEILARLFALNQKRATAGG